MSLEESMADGRVHDWVANDRANLRSRASMPRASVLLIEDHPLIYDGLLALFGARRILNW